jgi:hypothetical protein
MNVYATFSGDRYHCTTQKIVEDAPKFGADKVLVYDDVWLRNKRPQHLVETAYFVNHPRVRGVNFFCFKPFVILDAINRVGPDDVVLFTDGDTFPVARLDALFNIGKRDGIMLFMANGWPHQRVWCKRDCFILMDQDDQKWHDAHCAVARFMVFTRRHLAFLEEWLFYCKIKGCNTFDPSVLGAELLDFREHRCEQAILGNLAHKYGHRLYREACEYGDCDDEDASRDRDLYPRLFSQGVSAWVPHADPSLPRDSLGHYGSYFGNILN